MPVSVGSPFAFQRPHPSDSYRAFAYPKSVRFSASDFDSVHRFPLSAAITVSGSLAAMPPSIYRSNSWSGPLSAPLMCPAAPALRARAWAAEEITTAVAARTGNAWFAWDNYRRFLQNYGMAHDLTRDDFDAVIQEFKQRTGIPLKRQFTGDQMRALALAYRQLIRDAGIVVVDAPFEQLLLALRRVLHSWESPKAIAYRRIMGISDDWGTAIAVQAMVYGNRSAGSGTGVMFTHNPRWSGEVLRLWGDFTTTNQGEDVVSGLVRTMPVSLAQQEIEKRDTDITLETHFPGIYHELSRWARMLIEDHGWSPQEIEFTFESPASDDLYMLQTRDMAIRESPRALCFDPRRSAGRSPRSRDRCQRGGHERSGRVQPRGHCALARARTDHAPDPRPHGHGAGRHPGNSRGRRPVDRPGRGDLPRGRRGAPARQDLRRRVQ